MLERYCNFLRLNNSVGDVMAEARGKKEDRKLQEVFGSFMVQIQNLLNRRIFN